MQHFYIPALTLYVIAALICLTRLFSKQGPVSNFVVYPAIGALICHTIWLGQDMISEQGQDLGLLYVASLISLLISFIMTAATIKYRVWIMLPLAYGVSAMLLAAANLIPLHYVIHFEQQPELIAHIGFALLAFTTLMIASLFALQLWYLDHSLKSHSSMALHPALPPLMTVEKQLFWLIHAGVILLTLSLTSGFLFVDDMLAQGKIHKAILSSCAWLCYVILLWGHHKKGWRGHTVVIFSLLGSLLLTLAYFGSRFVKEILING